MGFIGGVHHPQVNPVNDYLPPMMPILVIDKMIRRIEIYVRLLFGGFSIIFIGYILKNLGLTIMGLIVTVSSMAIIKYVKENDFLVE